MKILIHDKNTDLTPDDREYAQEKFLKLAMLVKEPTTLEAHFERQRARITVHVTITHPHEKMPDHYDEKGHTIPEVINAVKERIEEHLRRKRERER